MRFRYKLYENAFLRPVIPVTLIGDDSRFGYEALIDSGADTSVFPEGIAEALGIEMKLGKPTKVRGVSGQPTVGYMHKIRCSVGGRPPMELVVTFFPKEIKMDYGILGQSGFFDKFVVYFDYKKANIEITPYK